MKTRKAVEELCKEVGGILLESQSDFFVVKGHAIDLSTTREEKIMSEFLKQFEKSAQKYGEHKIKKELIQKLGLS